MFSVFAKCFGAVSEDEWRAVTSKALWPDFIDAVRSALQDERPLGSQEARFVRRRGFCPLQEFLSEGEVSALFCPPTYQEKHDFAARHFTGGLPGSAVPIESLYAAGSSRAGDGYLRSEGAYLGDSARYMRELVARLGLEIPEEYSACPDHLALELDLTAVLLRSGMCHQALTFVRERFAWLESYRQQLLKIDDDDASFYIGLVDAVMGIWLKNLVSEGETIGALD